MKRSILIIFLFCFIVILFENCGHSAKTSQLQYRIDSLQQKLDSAYVPGTGELMNNIIQPHHYKLYLAGQQQNWALAEYERDQISGGFKRIIKYHKHSSVAAVVPMIYPELDALKKAIRDKSPDAFNNHFALLTNTCNNCHQATRQEFVVIKIPSTPAFENQNFKPSAKN